MLKHLVNTVIGNPEQRTVRKYKKEVEAINALESTYEKCTDTELQNHITKLKERVGRGESLDSVTVETFALVREAAKRTLNQRHYDVQLVGGMVLSKGAIAEMRTGEGKTLVATLPVVLYALAGKGVHVVTVNDYLARRDGVWMGQIYALLGLTTSVINNQSAFIYDASHTELDEKRDETAAYHVVHEFLKPINRKQAYQADITYGTNSEFGFDYLRDNIEYDVARLRQRGHAYAIVDEIDSILIDEARTPLIISSPAEASDNLYSRFVGIAESLQQDIHYTVDEKHHQVQLTDAGIKKAEELLGVDNIYTDAGIKYAYHLETAVRAKAIYKREKEYVVRDGEIVIVDEFTGRLQPGRRWSGGVHQAVEAKEGLLVQRESRTYASVTYQNFFRMYDRLCGMTGTADTSREEFYKVYGLDVVQIPTHRTIARVDKQDLMFQTEHGKYQALAREVKELQKKGQPVLIGTVSIEKNEQLSEYLKVAGVTHKILNAKNHESEGEIVAEAGKKGAVTVATNMAGRGVDIKLGGPQATTGEAQEVRELGGLYVIGTERHTARRIDNQLRGRSGRQGDPGMTRFYVSLDDTLMRVFAADTVKRIVGTLGLPEDESIENRLISRALESAQTKIEGINFDQRKQTLSYDDVLNYQRKLMYERRSAILKADTASLPRAVHDFFVSNEQGFNASEFDTVVETKVQELGHDIAYMQIRRLILQTIDMFWIDHLEEMEYVRSSVSLRSYGQRDPLVEYKREGLRIFKGMQNGIFATLLETIPKIAASVQINNKTEQEMKKVEEKAQLITGDVDEVGAHQIVSTGTPTTHVVDKTVGRNDRVQVRRGNEEKEVKFKHLEKAEAEGWQRIG